MNAGTLRHRLTFQVKPRGEDETKDTFGSIDDSWATDFEVMGAFESVGSREFPTEWKRHDETTARFRIRYKAGIDSARHRIMMTFDEYASPSDITYWDIFPPLPFAGKRRELIIEAYESR